MTHLLEFQKIQAVCDYDSVSYKSTVKINDEVFEFVIQKNAWKKTKYYVAFFHKNSWNTLFYNYSSAKKAMIDCQIYFNHLMNKIN
jgi:hypothetical protein